MKLLDKHLKKAHRLIDNGSVRRCWGQFNFIMLNDTTHNQEELTLTYLIAVLVCVGGSPATFPEKGSIPLESFYNVCPDFMVNFGLHE